MNMNTDFNSNMMFVNKVLDVKVDTSVNLKKENKSFDNVLRKEKDNISKVDIEKTVSKDSKKSINDKDAATVKNSTAAKDTTSDKVEVKDDNKAVEEIVENMSTDDLLSYLAIIADLLNNPTTKVDISIEGQGTDNINIDLKNTIMSFLSSGSDLKELNSDNLSNIESSISKLLNSTSGDDVTSILNNLLAALKDENIKDALDTDSLNTVKSFLKELGVRIEENPSIVNGGDNDLIKQLVNEIEGEVKTLLGSKSKEAPLKDVILDVPVQNDVKKVDNTKNQRTSDNNQSQGNSKQSNELDKAVAKEEKVLNSILGEDDSSKTGKFSLFSDRTITARVDAPVEAQVVNKATVTQDVIKNVKYMVNNNVKELTVRMNPKDLGEIAIKIVQEDGIMKASIKASSKDTLSLLSQNLNDIKKYLGEQNIKIQEVNIGLYNDDTTFFKDGEFENSFFSEGKDNSKKKSSNNNGAIVNEEIEEEIKAEDLSNINILA